MGEETFVLTHRRMQRSNPIRQNGEASLETKFVSRETTHDPKIPTTYVYCVQTFTREHRPGENIPCYGVSPIGEKPISFPCGPNPVATTFRDAILALTLGEYSW